MEKKIICMGNSYKNGGRCLAGIEVRHSENGYKVVRTNEGFPNWVRPVMDNGNNGIPEILVGSFSMLDVLSVEVTDAVPVGAHCENVHFSSIRKIGRIGQNTNNLTPLCDTYHNLIFGNRGKAVPNEVFINGGYSLMFIKPENPQIITQIDENNREKFRIQFSHNGVEYNLPLTDAKYIDDLHAKIRQRGLRNTGELYLTLSLGVNYSDWHYKLVAGVIDLAA